MNIAGLARLQNPAYAFWDLTGFNVDNSTQIQIFLRSSKMANTKSAKKEARKTIKRTVHNRGVKTRLKTLIKKARTALEGDDAATARKAVDEAVSAYDRAAKTNVVHKNKVSRVKSTFNTALNTKA